VSSRSDRSPSDACREGERWIKVGDNLPLVPVNDIDLPDGSETLYAATYGRSVWTTSLADAG
jgi:hypothetical protein